MLALSRQFPASIQNFRSALLISSSFDASIEQTLFAACRRRRSRCHQR